MGGFPQCYGWHWPGRLADATEIRSYKATERGAAALTGRVRDTPRRRGPHRRVASIRGARGAPE
ncbi:hypothetical protein GCM10009765_51040 [Fodinicola feengrottensis]|uniref:Uncharacterized protein n=1 Tax=Fodinicola feengrottensis TaxID=435914 RepID=A0ABP4TXJ9_9ACTN